MIQQGLNICLKSAQLTQHRFYQQKYTIIVYWHTLSTYSPDISISISIELKHHKTLRHSLVEQTKKK